jgi:hypothetical protein
MPAGYPLAYDASGKQAEKDDSQPVVAKYAHPPLRF